MASIELEVAGRKYLVACRDGEEPHLLKLAERVDRRARDAAEALGGLAEARQLLFASLLLADDLEEAKKAGGKDEEPGAARKSNDPGLGDALERLAQRMERLAERLEEKTTIP